MRRVFDSTRLWLSVSVIICFEKKIVKPKKIFGESDESIYKFVDSNLCEECVERRGAHSVLAQCWRCALRALTASVRAIFATNNSSVCAMSAMTAVTAVCAI